jgi:hypothetical protein
VSALAEELTARAAILVERVVAATYRDPFWDARYGERGRRYVTQDALYHVQYLAEALWAGSPESLVQYARWLQTVLTTRGMCSRHLAENLDRLADAIREEALPDAETAEAYLRAAVDGLRYPAGPAAVVQGNAARLARAVAAHLGAYSPDDAAVGRRGHAPDGDDLHYHLSYLADALALERPDLFADYTRWTAGYRTSRGLAAESLGTELAALDNALAALPAAAATAAHAVLTAGRAALVGEASPAAE